MHFIKIKVLFLWAFLLPGIVMYGCSKEVAGTTYMQDTTRRELSADNGIIKLKLDLSRGGAISYVSLSGSSRNLVNIHDEGRYIQQSYYAGKPLNRQADGQNPAWSPWRWNPIQGGDSYNHRSKVIQADKRGDTLYVKCIPMLWDMNNSPAEAVLEQWNVLEGNVIKSHCKITCHRTDNIYAENIATSQELPAVYPVSALDNLYAYLGSEPFKGDTLSKPTVVHLSSGFWGKYLNVSEHWMAFTDSKQFGLGVYNPECTSFLAGMAGKPGGEFADQSTSYIAPIKNVMLNKSSVYEFDFYIIIGSLDQIRQEVYKLN